MYWLMGIGIFYLAGLYPWYKYWSKDLDTYTGSGGIVGAIMVIATPIWPIALAYFCFMTWGRR